MKVITAANQMLKKGKFLTDRCQYFWNKSIRGIATDSPPTFLVGCPHSGTTLLLAILGSHSSIYAIPKESDIASEDDQSRFKAAIAEFDRATITAGKKRWIEKTPRHIRNLGRITTWTPDAKIIIIIRDGRDVVCSLKARNGDIEKSINQWVNLNRKGQEYWDNPNVYVVKYEDLIEKFEEVVSGILTFLDEPFESGMQDYHKTKRKWYSNKIEKPGKVTGNSHGQHRNWQINQPLFDGRGRWKELSNEDLELVH